MDVVRAGSGLRTTGTASAVAEQSDRLRLGSEVEIHTVPGGLFLSRVLERPLPNVRLDHWPTRADSLGFLGEPILRVAGDSRDSGVFELDGALLHLNLANGWVYVEAAADDQGKVDAAIARLRELLPAPDPSSAHEVTVTFWTYGAHGPQPSSRTIAVPEWEEIESNYTATTRAALGGMMQGFQPAHGGQLILWHGRAGTGKTFALRALAWEWRNWCELHYIVDPDSFFGQHADYLMSVLLQPAYSDMAAGFSPFIHGGTVMSFAAEPEAPTEKAWKLLVLEDTGELLAADARAAAGQGLARFLNVVDGLIGQGLRVLVLVTTNEEIRRLHPAVARPGRCAANVEFEPLSVDEAAEWLAARECSAEDVEAPSILASLYARLEGYSEGNVERSMGFAS